MNYFDKLCNQLLNEVYGKQLNIPYDGVPAPNRFNNPGGAYPSQKFVPFGLEGYGIIGGGHPIAKYPTLEQGVAANIFHLRGMPIVGKTVQQARNYWVNGDINNSNNAVVYGMDPNQVITPELLQDQTWLAQWMQGTARGEGFQGSIAQDTFAKAFNILDGKSDFQYNPNNQGEQYASNQENGQQIQSREDGFTPDMYQNISNLFAKGLNKDTIKTAMNDTLKSTKGVLGTYGVRF